MAEMLAEGKIEALTKRGVVAGHGIGFAQALTVAIQCPGLTAEQINWIGSQRGAQTFEEIMGRVPPKTAEKVLP